MRSELTLLEQIKLGKVWDFPGGVHPPERKEMSNQRAISVFQSPADLFIPLSQHIGATGDLLVKVGDLVTKGQPLTKANSGLSLPVHASTSGEIIDIHQHVVAHPSGKQELTLVLRPDGQNTLYPANPIADWMQLEKPKLLEHIQNMGISGMGGAGFPTYVKLGSQASIELLIINAVECEPYITSDDMLMREYAEEIVSGVQIMQHIVGSQITVIAIEENKPEAIAAMKIACSGVDNVEVRVVPTKYPSGGEKQLIQLITNQQVPSGKLPSDIGIVVQNVATAFAVKQAVVEGLPLTRRVVTVTGAAIKEPQNLWVDLGTPVQALVDHCGFKPEPKQRVIMGGPMMGFNIMDLSMPVVKICNCILAPSEYHLPHHGVEQACVRCGLCADACPQTLLPQQLQWFAKAKEHDKLEEYNLFDCIECGACAYVCPSQIPLVQYYRTSKAEIREAKEEKIKSDKAKERFEKRQERLERDKQERMQKHKDAAAKRAKAMAGDSSAKDKIAAALARAKAKKSGQGKEEDTETVTNQAVTETQPNPKDKVAAAIARAKAKKAAQSGEHSAETEAQNQTETPANSGDDKKDKVAAAIARAKAKKAAQNRDKQSELATAEPTDGVTPVTTAEDDKKAKVAAAIARAKAKKQAEQEAASPAEPPQLESEHSVASENNTESDTEETATDAISMEKTDAEQEKKDKVAAAIARAKAKKLAKDAEKSAQPPAGDLQSDAEAPLDTESEQLSSAAKEANTEVIDAEQEKKDKVAAAIARAKAKKAQKDAEKQATVANTDEATEEPAEAEQNEAQSPEEIKKAKVAAAIAKAKAKKLAAEEKAAKSESSEGNQ